MKPFVFQGSPQRIVFGAGKSRTIGAEVERLGLKRVIVLSTPNQADAAARVAAQLDNAIVVAEAVMHTPVDVTERVCAVVRSHRADGVVSIGGGSTVGLGKAIAYRTDLPQIVVPTTYAGSEVTDMLGQTENGEKKTVRAESIRPEVVVYDVEQTLTLPPALSMTSGLNAIAHAVEALYAPDGNPVIEIMAEEGIRALFGALPGVFAAPTGLDPRSEAQYGAWLCGTVMGMATMGLHHKICHVLGGAFGLPHAETHSIVLPHVIAFNAPAIPGAMTRLQRAMSTSDPVTALGALQRMTGLPTTLSEIGMPASGIAQAARTIAGAAYKNARAPTFEDLRDLLTRATGGHEDSAARPSRG